MQKTRLRAITGTALAVAIVAGCKKSSPAGPSTPVQVEITNRGTGVTTYTYTADIAPIVVDCLPCHGPQIQNATYNFSTYEGVLRALTPGSEQSRIVLMTQPNGPMFVNMTGDRNAKSGIIYDWVVRNNAAR